MMTKKPIRKRICAALLLGLCVLALGHQPLRAQSPSDWAALNDRLNNLEQRLRSLQPGRSNLSRNNLRRPNMPSSNAGELSLRISTIEGQLRNLTGQLEDLSFRLRRLNKQFSRFSNDTGRPFGDPRNLGRRPPPRNAVPPRGLAPSPAQRPQVFGPQAPAQRSKLRIIQPGENSSLRRGAPPATLGRIPADNLPRDVNPQANLPESALTQPFIDEGGSLYARAYDYYISRDFAVAESSFRGFLRRYPEHELNAQAQYWLGESFYARNKYRQAARAFLIGYRKYPKSGKAPASLLKLGMSLHRLGDKNQACATFDKLAREYKKAPKSVKKTTAAERKNVGC